MNRGRALSWLMAAGVATAVVTLSRLLALKSAQAHAEIDALVRQSAAPAATDSTKSTIAANPTSSSDGARDVAAPEAARSAKPMSEAEVLRNRYRRRTELLQAWTAHTYGPWLRSAALTPVQADAFQQALVNHWLRWSEVVDAGRAQGWAPGDEGWKELGKQEWTQFRQEKLDAIGAAALEGLDRFERGMQTITVAETVAALTFNSDTPLSAEQGATLARVLANNSKQYRQGGSASLDDLNQPAVLAHLKDVLSPTQLAALETIFSRREAGPALNKRIAELQTHH